MKCAECKAECEEPITKVDMSFSFDSGRWCAADWSENKAYCCVSCMMTGLRRGVDRSMRVARKAKKFFGYPETPPMSSEEYEATHNMDKFAQIGKKK